MWSRKRALKWGGLALSSLACDWRPVIPGLWGSVSWENEQIKWVVFESPIQGVSRNAWPEEAVRAKAWRRTSEWAEAQDVCEWSSVDLPPCQRWWIRGFTGKRWLEHPRGGLGRSGCEVGILVVIGALESLLSGRLMWCKLAFWKTRLPVESGRAGLYTGRSQRQGWGSCCGLS